MDLRPTSRNRDHDDSRHNHHPNHSGIRRWPVFTAANRATMVFNDEVEVKSDPDREARTLVQSIQQA